MKTFLSEPSSCKMGYAAESHAYHGQIRNCPKGSTVYKYIDVCRESNRPRPSDHRPMHLATSLSHFSTSAGHFRIGRGSVVEHYNRSMRFKTLPTKFLARFLTFGNYDAQSKLNAPPYSKFPQRSSSSIRASWEHYLIVVAVQG